MARAWAQADLPIKQGDLLLGKYLIGKTLGAGGMGVVVEAQHVQLGQKVAVKILPAALRGDADRVTRFVREARAAARIRSEHVVRVVDVSAADSDVCYMVMEYLEGVDLAQLLAMRGCLPPDEAVGYVLQACEAIAEAHGAGVVHRDLKPSNLFLTKRRDGSPLIKVLDFGISKVALSTTGDGPVTDLTSTMAIMGSPVYMSPEQVRSSKTVDARSDIWSLGVILHELVTGKPVFISESATELLAMIVADPPTPLRQLSPSLPASLEATVLACLEKQASQRVPDIAALARRLQPLAPRWAASSVERIVGAAGVITSAAERGPSAKFVTPSQDATLPLPSEATTSAQLSGELVPATPARAGVDTGRKLPPYTDTAPLTRERPGRWRPRVIVAVGSGCAAAIVALVLLPAHTPPAPVAAPRPTVEAPSLRTVEPKPAIVHAEVPGGVPEGLAPGAGQNAPSAEKPDVKVRDMSPEESAAAQAKMDARGRDEKPPAPPRPPRAPATGAEHVHKPGGAKPKQPARVAGGTGSAAGASPSLGAPPSAPKTASPLSPKDPLDGRR